MSDQSEINTQQSKIRNRGGAPKGNLNALKHGFYTSRFNRDELRSLDDNVLKGINDEIAMLRLIIRRHVTYTNEIQDFDKYNQALRTLCLACTSLNRFLRTQFIIQDTQHAEYARNIEEAIEQLTVEWNLRDQP